MNALLETHSNKLLAAMTDVKSFETRLAQLNSWWGKITLIGKINSHNVGTTILEDMNRTQGKFGELQRKLTHNLLVENLQKLVLDNASRAQVAIDLLTRNLFERTADVGFLATDDDLRVFLSHPHPETDLVKFIENRLKEYVRKYSVYDEIIVFDSQGRVRAHLNGDNPIIDSNDPLIEATLTTDQPYVETFRYSELQPDRRQALIYSCKITATDQKDSQVLGVLCLCFRFEDEIQGIFANLLPGDTEEVISILDVKGRVIASSNETILPLNTPFNIANLAVINFQSRDYIVNMRHTNGYQGFHGLGWRGLMMTRLDKAFNRNNSHSTHEAYADLIDQAHTFPPALKEIRHASADINADLGLLVLNGKIASARKDAAEFMPVLEAIKQVGTDIADIFTESVNSLQEVTVMSSHLNNAGFLASLAVDIMDRNLYERANDCRWWALTSAFRRNLAKPALSDADRQQMNAILGYINDLYTVYTNLYIYDIHGKIVAVSDHKQAYLIGSVIDESTGFKTALRNADSQNYTVSDFVPTILYEQRQTYIYHAAITDLNDNNKILGGIGIVFDSQPQFTDMLGEILPKESTGELLKNSFALFTDRKGIILGVANHQDYRVGDKLPLDEAYFALKNGQTHSKIIRYQNTNYVLGIAVSKGYREYKTSDRYQNDVLALVFIPV